MPEHNKGRNKEHDDNRISELYQQSCDDTMDTSKLDQEILAAARAELSQKIGTEPGAEQSAKVVKFTGWRRWSTPLATAACLLLAVSLSFNVAFYQQRDEEALTSAAVQAPIAEIQAVTATADDEIAREVSLTPRIQQAEKKSKRQQLDSRLLETKESRLSKAEADKIFEGLEVDEEAVVTGSRLRKPEAYLSRSDSPSSISLNPDLPSSYPKNSFPLNIEQRIDAIIKLLENGQLEEAKQQLALLIEDYPELVNP